MNNAVSPVRRLFSELRRRRLFRTAALYIVGTWLVLQVADVVFPAMDIPERAIRYLLVAALLGFPAALVFGWFYDVGAHGIRRTGPAGPDEVGAAHPLRRSDYVILTAFAGVVVFILYSTISIVIDAPREVREVSREGPPMVAVLPFASASLEGDSEFFANGVHDDLLTQLSKLQSIRVISRTSVLEYRNTTRNIREIGRALGADAILEGGVQIANDQIRINAQLIRAETDEHLWAHTYNRQLSTANIFDVQAEIAKAIASALNAVLTNNDTSQLSAMPTENMAAYRAYHRAMALWSTEEGWLDPAYLEALEEAVSLDPNFARAWAEIVCVLSYSTLNVNDPAVTQHAEEALQTLEVIAPGSADYLFAQASYFYYIFKDYDRAHEVISKALELNPSNVRTVELKSWIEQRQGDFDARTESMRLAQKLDPRNLRWTESLVWSLMKSHRYDEAAAEVERSPVEGPQIELLQEALEFRRHRDFGRFRNEVEARYRDYPGIMADFWLWQARVGDRDFAGVLDLVPEITEGDPYPGDSEERSFYTFWLMGDTTSVKEALARARSRLDDVRNEDGEFDKQSRYLHMALVAGAEGSALEAEQMIRRWERFVPADRMHLSESKHKACEILGLIASAEAAVACLREGISEPSWVNPYREVYLPYYDSIRDEPAFIELLGEIDREWPAATVH